MTATSTFDEAIPGASADAAQRWFTVRRTLLVVLLIGMIVLSNLASYAFFRYLDVSVAGTEQTFAPNTWEFVVKVVFPPIGAIGLAAFVLLIEAWGMGWQQSSLRRLLSPANESTRNDLFYLLLYVSGLKPVLAFLFSLGTGYAIHRWVTATFSVQLLEGVSFIPALAVVTLVNSLLFYWNHRLMHSRWLWEIHKVHHSAEEMNLITPHRNHPIDSAVTMVTYALPSAVLGASEPVILTYTLLNGFYQSMAHSNLDWKLDRFGLGWVERWLLISSGGHRIHHSKSPEHWNRNFGITPLWDRLFGTWWPGPTDMKLEFGVDDSPIYNSGRPVRELWSVFRQAVLTARTEFRKLVGRRGSASRTLDSERAAKNDSISVGSGT
ncbi:MAG TPA: sterol desaturase family protein [Pirellulales bacterium]|nr:sterol desaturase family protein [Pirellulales bacterium]